ncbi:MAG: DUF402 domain-containing protein [Aerococcus sp.]|nr:DUF402 domain-containing protein [Aerococcus sp.]
MHHPKEGEFITVQSYKHDGTLHRTWKDCMVLKTSGDSVIACNDHTLVIEDNGRKWVTREPALLYFHKKYWFNVVTMIRSNGISYYSNLASPYILDQEALKYIDYDLDIKIFPNGEKRLLDSDEYLEHSREMHYPEEIDVIIKSHLNELIRWIDEGLGPFSPAYVDIWYRRYCQLCYRLKNQKQRRKHKKQWY